MWTDLLLAAGAALAAAFVAVIVANLVMVQRGIEYEISKVPALDSSDFLRLMKGLTSLQLRSGNQIRLLLNGQEAFPAMFDAVQGAEQSVTFENYVYWSGKVGRHFARLLADKANEGVRVHVVLDWVGSLSMDRESLKSMEAAGVEVHRYHSPRFGGMHLLNHRTHRRELVIDGRVAFTGGIGFGDKWSGDGESTDNWRDNHYEVHGPVVGDIQAAFLDNWLKTSGNILVGDNYFPDLESRGKHLAGILCSSPTERATSGRLLILMLVAGANATIRIEQAYFIADKHLRHALVEAAERGVEVEILLPGKHIDIGVVRRASRMSWKRLLQAGVRIYEYQPTMLHVKAMVVDDQWVVAGSANLDFRSLYRNDEIYLVVRDHQFARQHVDAFTNDKQHAAEITLADWKKRPVAQRLVDGAASLLRTQL